MSCTNRRIICYAVHEVDGTVISAVGNELAWPILDYTAIGEGGDFTAPLTYHLERVPRLDACHDWPYLRWTRKIPTAIKNRHRQFWGMPLLPDPTHEEPSR